jgi:hypothetical protein
MKCRVGDLAVVVRADLECNIGNIVRVIAPVDGSHAAFKGQGQVWMVECQRDMTWLVKDKTVHRRRGPVPDNRLQPIRGETRGLEEDQGIDLEAKVCSLD